MMQAQSTISSEATPLLVEPMMIDWLIYTEFGDIEKASEATPLSADSLNRFLRGEWIGQRTARALVDTFGCSLDELRELVELKITVKRTGRWPSSSHTPLRSLARSFQDAFRLVIKFKALQVAAKARAARAK